MGFVIEPISAWLSDRVGRRVILYTSTFMCGVVVFSIFTALQAQYTGTTYAPSRMLCSLPIS
jgi:MFS family permease